MQRIAIVGGGPGGLFLASLLRRRLPSAQITLFERNRRTDAFGFGVVFSDATLRHIDEADPVLRDGLRDFGRHWDRIDVWVHGERHGFGGNGMAAIHRRILLRLLQDNAEEAGVDLRFGTTAPPVEQLRSDYDLVVGADGTNSAVREHLEARQPLGHHVETASAKFIWFGTTYLFHGLTFVHRESEHGAFAVHGYPISDELSTFIVETDAATWRRAQLDRFDVGVPPGPSDTDTQAYLEKLFADDIEGERLVANNSRWASFHTRRTDRWWDGNVVLLGDAVHTAHFSVGSGTKMAMEDALTLSGQVAGHGDDLPAALTSFQEIRRASVGRIQDAARPSLSWWEHFGSYQRDLDPLTFCFHFFSRSIDIDRIAERDPELARTVREQWERTHGAPALDTPLDLGTSTTSGRLLPLESVDRHPDMHLVEAPESEADLPHAVARLPQRGVVVVHGGSDLSRVLLSEEARLRRGLVSILVLEGQPDLAARAETLILSGRADAVAVRAPGRTT